MLSWDGITVNIYSLKKITPQYLFTGKYLPPVIISQETNNLGSYFLLVNKYALNLLVKRKE